MPIKFIRLLIAFTLALAIPLQGVASVTAGVCMAIGHHEAGTPDSHEHGHDSDHSAPHEDDSAASHCAPCVACCAAASISPARQVYLPHDSPPAAIAALAFLPPGFLPEKLDRPPLGL